MENVEWLQNIQKLINFFLRYIVAGGSAVLAFGLTQQDPFSFLRIGNEVSVLLLLLFISVVGPTIYSVHKAVLHEIVVKCIEFFSRPKDLKNVSLQRFDLALEKQLEQWRQNGDAWLSTYEPWAAQVHFLYCSAWGTAVALGLARQFNPNAKNFLPIVVVGSVLFIAAVVSDFRLTRLQIVRSVEAGAFATYSQNKNTVLPN
ncbi:MAG TPA: hypothetical protein VFM05_08040 [Candidatus Saccharimonadales bacterium]|nr:hypothetical protein [Candidatus Saccharimonadales bacterium]